MNAYLDNNVVSSIARDDTASESDALDALMAAYDAGKVDLVTSELTLEEIKKYSSPRRKPVERTFRLLEKVPVVGWDELLGIHSYGDQYTWISSHRGEDAAITREKHSARLFRRDENMPSVGGVQQ